MSAFVRLLDALTHRGCTVKANGVRATAQCPSHEDRAPSLSVTAIEGQVLVYCHAGCETTEVLASLGLAQRDLFDEPKGAAYSYTDRSGSTVLRTVHRSPDKRFRQTVTDKSTVPLYRLQAVAKAVRENDIIFVCEGEKDVHALESLGVVATTAPMGATNAHKADWTPLHGARVVVVADRDKAGDTYAGAVLESLTGKAESVRIVVAKVGKDASDHVAAGYGIDGLVPHEPAAAAPVLREVKLTAASAIQVRPVRWLLSDRLALGSLALLGGREGIGKSLVAIALAGDITRGRLRGLYEGQPKSVIVAATEDSWEHTIVPRLLAAGADLDRVYRVDVTTVLGVDTGLSLPRDRRCVACGTPTARRTRGLAHCTTCASPEPGRPRVNLFAADDREAAS